MRLLLLLGLLGVALYGVGEIVASAPKTPQRQGLATAERAPATVGQVAESVGALLRQEDTVPVAATMPATPAFAEQARPTIVAAALVAPEAVLPMQGARATATTAPARALEDGFARVNVDAANLRAGPSTGHGVVGRLRRGDEVLVVEASVDGWSRVVIEGDGVEGWVATRLLQR